MWIMLTAKLPTMISPPKLSIHWSELWPEPKYIKEQQKSLEKGILTKGNFDNVYWRFDFANNPIKEPDYSEARAIVYKREKIRVFPHEFSEVTKENFVAYRDAYDLVPGDIASEILMRRLRKGQRFVYDAALLDGCDRIQATIVALGGDPSGLPPPIGWWRLREEYANHFCYTEEQAG